MKKVLLAGCICALMCGSAMADFTYTETETVTIVERVYDAPVVRPVMNDGAMRFASSRDVMTSRPCAKRAGNPVRVKTHSEVIDHYQVYQPVTVYKPMGEQIERRIVPAKKCNKCL